MRLADLISKPYPIVNEIATLISSIKLRPHQAREGFVWQKTQKHCTICAFCLTDITKQTGVGGVHSNLEKRLKTLPFPLHDHQIMPQRRACQN